MSVAAGWSAPAFRAGAAFPQAPCGTFRGCPAALPLRASRSPDHAIGAANCGFRVEMKAGKY